MSERIRCPFLGCTSDAEIESWFEFLRIRWSHGDHGIYVYSREGETMEAFIARLSSLSNFEKFDAQQRSLDAARARVKELEAILEKIHMLSHNRMRNVRPIIHELTEPWHKDHAQNPHEAAKNIRAALSAKAGSDEKLPD